MKKSKIKLYLSIKKKVFNIFIISPIFNVGIDQEYGRFKYNRKKLKNIRLSLITLNFGVRIYYIITYKKSSMMNKFEFIKVIDLKKKLQKNNRDLDREAKLKSEKYIKEIENMSIDKIEINNIFLEKQVDRLKEKESKLDNKAMYYITVSAIIIPASLLFLTENEKINVLKVSSAFILYNSLIILYLTISIFEISSFYLESFKMFKENKNKKLELEKNLYRKWYLLRHDDMKTNYIIQIEEKIKNIFYIILITIGISIIKLIPLKNKDDNLYEITQKKMLLKENKRFFLGDEKNEKSIYTELPNKE